MVAVSLKKKAKKIGEGRVYIDEYDERKDGEALRLIGMLNMAFLASQIPNNTPPDEIGKYEPLLDIIKKQFRELSGIDPASDKLLITAEGIRIKLPRSVVIPLDKSVDEYYRLTIEQLEQNV